MPSVNVSRELTRSKSRYLRFAFAGLTTLLVAGCSALTPGSTNEGSASPTQNVQTDASKMGQVDLTVWGVADAEDQLRSLVNEFEQQYPNISIGLEIKSYSDLVNTSKLVLSSNSVPDVMSTDDSLSTMGPLVKAGLVRPLDGYAAAYGWTREFPNGILKQLHVSSDGQVAGTGSLYGLPQFGEEVGLYYNRAKLGELGLQLPTTLSEFESDMAKAKAAGQTPLQVGTLDKQLGLHLYSALYNAYVSNPEDISNVVFGSAPIASDASREAANTIVRWAHEGYYPSDFQGVGELTTVQRFIGGKGLFLIDGSWANTQLAKSMGNNVGFIGMPRSQGGTPVITGGGSIPFVIPSHSDHADAAAAFINFACGQPNVQVSLRTNQMPALPVPPGEAPAGSVVSDTLTRWREAGEANTLVPYLAYATPTFWNTGLASVQELLGGKLSTEEFINKMQADLDQNGTQS
jgi:raffinose/stachyose/melibiose transport system substrate-binding protein